MITLLSFSTSFQKRTLGDSYWVPNFYNCMKKTVDFFAVLSKFNPQPVIQPSW